MLSRIILRFLSLHLFSTEKMILNNNTGENTTMRRYARARESVLRNVINDPRLRRNQPGNKFTTRAYMCELTRKLPP